jgi:hypothetical protein
MIQASMRYNGDFLSGGWLDEAHMAQHHTRYDGVLPQRHPALAAQSDNPQVLDP